MAHISFKDFFHFDASAIKDNVKFFHETKDSASETGHSIKCQIRATFSAVINKNNRFDMPHAVKKGAASLLDEYPKPILVGHYDEIDPIGRVSDYEYVDISSQFQIPKIKSFLDPKTSYISKLKVVDFIVENLIPLKGYKGLGYIDVIADISDPRAIRKILDGRYLTVSIGGRSDKMVCSVCKTDWVSEDYCEHTPGVVYDGKRAFLISGNILYNEISFVNKPANPHSQVVKIDEANNVRDEVRIGSNDDFNDHCLVSFDLTDSCQGEEEMAVKKKRKKKVEDIEKDIKDKDVNTEDKEEVKDSKANDDVKDNNVDEEQKEHENVKASSEDNENNGNVVDEEEKEDSSKEEELPAIEEIIKDEEANYEAIAAVLDELELSDAKLSAEQRKKLKGSTFCGPNRSFPVPDCAHVTAAKRLLGRYKGSGSKSAILACVERKAKKLGCNKDAEEEKSNNQATNETKVTDKELLEQFNGLVEQLKERGIYKCPECESLQKDLEDKNNELFVVNSRNTVLEDEINAVEESYVELKDKFNEYKKDVLKVYKKALGEDESITDKEVEDLDNILDSYKEKINNPQSKTEDKDFEKIEDPTLKDDNNSEDKSKVAAVKDIMDKYHLIRRLYGLKAASDFIQKSIKSNK